MVGVGLGGRVVVLGDRRVLNGGGCREGRRGRGGQVGGRQERVGRRGRRRGEVEGARVGQVEAFHRGDREGIGQWGGVVGRALHGAGGPERGGVHRGQRGDEEALGLRRGRRGVE